MKPDFLDMVPWYSGYVLMIFFSSAAPELGVGVGGC